MELADTATGLAICAMETRSIIDKDAEIARLKDELERAQQEVDEVLDSTKEIEAQLEQDVALAEKQLQNVKRRNEDLTRDTENWKARFMKAQKENEKEIQGMRKELDNLTKAHTEMRGKLRDEELKHDDLEKQERIVTTSYQDLETKYHEVLERNADLESELASQVDLKVECQRLKDEIRDLTAELAVAYNSGRKVNDENNEKPDLPDESSTSSDLESSANRKHTYFINESSAPENRSEISYRPPSRLATSNSVKNIQSLSTTIAALREKMKAARAEPSKLCPPSKFMDGTTLPVPQKSLARMERPSSRADYRSAGDSTGRSVSSLGHRSNLQESTRMRRQSSVTGLDPPLAPPTKNVRARANSNLSRTMGSDLSASTSLNSPTPGRRVSMIPSPAGRSLLGSDIATPTKRSTRRESGIPHTSARKAI